MRRRSMAKGLNRVMLIGNLGKDPELRYTTSGVAVASFSLATTDSWKDQDGNLQEKTEWHNIVVWKKPAEIAAEYLKKGKKVFVEGRIQTRSYDDKNTGAKKYITEIVADNFIFLDSKGVEAAPAASPAVESPAAAAEPGEDLPF
jgi:single-strand DNA-binding protein